MNTAISIKNLRENSDNVFEALKGISLEVEQADFLPCSGLTALQQISRALPSLLAGGAIFNPSTFLPAVAGLGLPRSAYSPTGTRAINTLPSRRPEAVQGFLLNPVLTGSTGVATGQGLFGR